MYILCLSCLVFAGVLAVERWTYPNITLKGTVKIYDKYGQLIYEYAGVRGYKREIRLKQIPQSTITAVLTTEDKRFYGHPGIDPLAMLRALKTNLAGRAVTGASTITQQLVRKVSFSDSDFGMSNRYVRKIREIITALRLEMTLSKDEILENYLNEMYFGNNAYGIESASNIYFGKSARNLTLAESAFLSAIIASPYSYDPITNYQAVKNRQEEILKKIKKNGGISEEELELALSQNITVGRLYVLQNTEAYHFADYVLKVAKGYPEVDRLIQNNSPIAIKTTLDFNKQKDYFDIAKYNLKKLDPGHNVTNASLVLINNDTGAVEVMIGGVDYFNTSIKGSVNMAEVLRQPGSTIKPVVYALAFSQGYFPSYVIADEKRMYITKSGDGYIPQNYDNIYRGKVSLRLALAASLNVPAVELTSRLGVDKFIATARAMGIKSYDRADYDLAAALGGGEVSLLDLTNMYATLARAGKYLDYYTIEEITDGKGNSLYKHEPKAPRQVLGDNGQEVAYLVTDILSDPKARMLTFGEKNLLNLTKRTAAKTGTTSNWHDVWTVGYTKGYTLGVWAGNNDNTPMVNISGMSGAAPIWNAVFEKIHQTQPYEDFKAPSGIESKLVCRQTGLPETCPDMYTDLFITAQDTVSTMRGADFKPKLEIINPRQNAVFKLADGILSRTGIAFEARASDGIDSLTWVLDGQEIKKTASPFEFMWTPTPGRHTLVVQATTPKGERLESIQITFEVL